jgi:flagellar assembly factor FliW
MNTTSDGKMSLAPIVSFDPGEVEASRRGVAPRSLESRRFGRLEVYPDQVLHFPHGLLGFEELQEFCILAPPPLQPLTFLVALDVPDVAFPILPARSCLPEYAPTLPADALDAVGAASPNSVNLLAICAVAPDTMTLHANLRGPLLINPQTRWGYQAVLHDSPYSLRHLLGAA